MTKPSDLERAHEYWNWFQTAPHSECRDQDCKDKLAAEFAAVRAEERKAAIEECLRIVEGKTPFAHEQLSDAERIRALLATEGKP